MSNTLIAGDQPAPHCTNEQTALPETPAPSTETTTTETPRTEPTPAPSSDEAATEQTPTTETTAINAPAPSGDKPADDKPDCYGQYATDKSECRGCTSLDHCARITKPTQPGTGTLAHVNPLNRDNSMTTLERKIKADLDHTILGVPIPDGLAMTVYDHIVADIPESDFDVEAAIAVVMAAHIHSIILHEDKFHTFVVFPHRGLMIRPRPRHSRVGPRHVCALSSR